MPKVLIIGATGYIGRSLALSLLRSGAHTVYGLARTPSKASLLTSLEIIPILGDFIDSAAYLAIIASAHIDVVVDVSGVNDGSYKILEDLKKVGSERLEAAQKAGVRTPKLGFVYTSGVWVHGSSMDAVSDLDPVGVGHAATQPPQLVAWRPALEQAVIAANDVLDTVVVRPGLVYGGPSAIWTSLFKPLFRATQSSAGIAEIAADEDSMPGLIHVEDAASGIHAAVEKLPFISGTGVYPIFDLVSSTESMKVILESAAKAMGFKGKVEMIKPKDDLFAIALNCSINSTSARARTLLGWEPRRVGMVARMEVYAKAWVESQKTSN
ncbi:NAD(P)-binding protein [Lepidopterella palustris CBS 459.81]|uniref:NAD(P)-binding protein n=1 Tax=Lepidopterella palustris CBS 459.81 TaxID=1314670 RepID=A0A8E2EA12_9PEZI|nr:NAD(P)-binding protein [Lepidopterella palustris CBS 459.81]